jgi:hypothetical protein
MKLTKQQQQHLLLVGILTLAVCGGIWFGLIQRQNRGLAATVSKMEQARTKQNEIRNLVNARERINAELDANARQIAAIEGTFAEEPDLYSWFIIKLREFQLAYNVDTPQISREVVGEMLLLPGFPYRQATYSIRGTAYYEELGRFIADFENRFPYFRLLNLEVDLGGGTAAEPEKLNFRLDVSTLVKPALARAD